MLHHETYINNVSSITLAVKCQQHIKRPERQELNYTLTNTVYLIRLLILFLKLFWDPTIFTITASAYIGNQYQDSAKCIIFLWILGSICTIMENLLSICQNTKIVNNFGKFCREFDKLMNKWVHTCEMLKIRSGDNEQFISFWI